jgi:hypothetical protein
MSLQLHAIAIGGLFVTIASSCATEHESYGQDGRKAYALNCSGMARGRDKCFSAAGNICGVSGYDVLDRSDESAAVESAGGSRGSFSAAYIQTHERSMLVACKMNKPAG